MNVLEFHIIQNVPSSNINRGEDGDAKTCTFGGTLRHRVSSQAWKRPMRLNIQEVAQQNGDPSGCISRKFEEIISEKYGLEKEAVFQFFKNVGLSSKKGKKSDKPNKKTNENDETNQEKDVLMYLSSSEIDFIVDSIKNDTVPEKEMKSFIKDKKLKVGLDIALFGRMFASNTDMNVYGAVKMSHAISTHTIELDDDYFSAVDQLDVNGAGHIGHNTFVSSCLYRYIAIDLDQLNKNLYGSGMANSIDLILNTIYTAFPKGKENSFAAYTRPSFMNVVLKNGQPYQYVNAFEIPVESTNGYIQESISKLKEFKKNELSIGIDNILLDVELSPEIPMSSISEQIKKNIAQIYGE